ncbi:kinase-like protein [Hypoxylon sp. FL0543]|nr:kinase-like protein [Hypoxylon sp. FL0543]
MAAPQTQALPPAMSSPLPSQNQNQNLNLHLPPLQVSQPSCSSASKPLLHPSVDTATTATTTTISATDAATVPARLSSSAATASSGILSLLRRPPFYFLNKLTVPPTDLSPSPSPVSLNTTTFSCSAYCNHNPTPIESLRRYPLDTSPIPEEGDEETGSESFSNEPVTPVSGRQSRDFRYCEQNDNYQRRDSITNAIVASSSGVLEPADIPLSIVNKNVADPSFLYPAPTHLTLPSQLIPPPSHAPPPPPSASKSPVATVEVQNKPFSPSQESRPTSARRPSSPLKPIPRRSSSTLSTISTKAMSFFKRNSYHVGDRERDGSAVAEFRDPNYDARTSESTLASANRITPNSSRRRFSFHRSVATTRSNTPPSPGSPEEVPPNDNSSKHISIPSTADFLQNHAKARANTGSLLGRVPIFGRNHPRRTKSVERKKKNDAELTRQPWAIPPDAGTGMKARRLSLSLPDDFTVDVADLMKEYEYQHKFLGRHGKSLGKGATSKVTLMVRKGSPGELYAVKEFRSKSSSETVEEYEKKIKSEYSIAKSLHHPNIVETVRLCTNHGRWNHVMEYCSEGDLFNLVSKKYLKSDSRETDRLCLFKQLCQGINYLHSNGIAHRDIKLENLLITKDSKLKITDFGVSEVFSGIHPGLREAGGQCGIGMGEVRLCKPGICGSLPYIAPEVLSKNVEYDPRALDVWSSAIVMLYLIFNANLWEKAQVDLPGQQMSYIELVTGWEKISAKRAANPDSVAKDAYPKVHAFELYVNPVPLRRILLNMLNPDPTKRITMHDVVTNRWMKNVECCQLESYEDPVKFIDASKKDCMKSSTGKIFCHNHLPPTSTGHGLPPMPGKPGY